MFQLIGLKAFAERFIMPKKERKYYGNRELSKSDNLILFDFICKLFEHNNKCPRSKRLQDHEILKVVSDEFPLHKTTERNYVSVWRNMYNEGRLHTYDDPQRTFVAFRVNPQLQFTKSTSNRIPLTLSQLQEEYKRRGIELTNQKLIKEVIGYSKEVT